MKKEQILAEISNGKPYVFGEWRSGKHENRPKKAGGEYGTTVHALELDGDQVKLEVLERRPFDAAMVGKSPFKQGTKVAVLLKLENDGFNVRVRPQFVVVE